jgi:hypothetical protein
MAYAPQPNLADQLRRALDARGGNEVDASTLDSANAALRALLKRLGEEIPAKWLCVAEQVARELSPSVWEPSAVLADAR